MTLLETPSVAVDGEALRRIREQKRLTQLYVAKVVGVTTDTVSRWENNRYPTIRRENAVKLADALEVELAEIIRPPDAETPAQQPPEKMPPWWRGRFLLLLIVPLAVLVLLLVSWFTIQSSKDSAPPQLVVERITPAHAAPGQQIVILVEVAGTASLKGMILREDYPPGWTFGAAQPEAASRDDSSGEARWIVRHPVLPLQVYYRLEVPRQATIGTDVFLTGELIANPDGQHFSIPVGSAADGFRIAPFHWADADANLVIDDLEILEFSELVEKIPELEGEWPLVEQIWLAGGYRWDDRDYRFLPGPGAVGPDE
ncbi:MAG: helix-turn-helix transcriptional regulator [Pelovirga sp.]